MQSCLHHMMLPGPQGRDGRRSTRVWGIQCSFAIYLDFCIQKEFTVSIRGNNAIQVAERA
jgi:hypothetical protein